MTEPTPEPVVEETPAPASVAEPASATEEPSASSEPTVESEAPVAPEAEPDTSAEDASDAALRAWAKDNGIEGVPGSGKLSAAWRDQITAAMTAALDPKEEASAEVASPESSSSETSSEEPVVEYRTPYVPPETWVTGQLYTA